MKKLCILFLLLISGCGWVNNALGPGDCNGKFCWSSREGMKEYLTEQIQPRDAKIDGQEEKLKEQAQQLEYCYKEIRTVNNMLDIYKAGVSFKDEIIINKDEVIKKKNKVINKLKKELKNCNEIIIELSIEYLIVTAGDCLWSISEDYYHCGRCWTEIWKDNKEIIDDPDLIFPNQILEINTDYICK